jgi:hypothetical protein
MVGVVGLIERQVQVVLEHAIVSPAVVAAAPGCGTPSVKPAGRVKVHCMPVMLEEGTESVNSTERFIVFPGYAKGTLVDGVRV